MIVMLFVLGKALLSLLFYTNNPYFFTTFFKFLYLLFPYFFVEGHLKACICKITFSRVSHIQKVNDYKLYPDQSINNLDKPVAKMCNNFPISH